MHGGVGLAGALGGTRAAMLRDQQVALGLGLRQLLLQLMESGAQIFHLRLLVSHLLRKTFGHLLIAERAFERCLGQLIVFLLLHGEFGLAVPLGGLLFALVVLFLQQ